MLDTNNTLTELHPITLEKDNCVICLEGFKSGESIRELPCKHFYHPHCIDPWLTQVSPLCPLCKADSVDLLEDISSESLNQMVSCPRFNNITNTITQSDASVTIPAPSSATRQHFPRRRWIQYLSLRRQERILLPRRVIRSGTV